MNRLTLRTIFFSVLLIASLGTQALGERQATTSSEEKSVLVYGQKIHYVEAGTGPVVILLHGLGGSTLNWLPNITPLATKFRVLVPDQLGFGKSDKPIINYRIATYVDFLEEFRKQLKIEKASLVGNSMGGWIAAAYAIAHPERVDRLVLEDAAGFAPPANFDMRVLYSLNPSTRAGIKVLGSKLFYNPLFSSDAVIDQALAQRLAAGDGYAINSIVESIGRREDFLDEGIKTIKHPTLIVWGREDGLTPLADGERFDREIPNSTLLIIDQCGHLPNIEKPGEFNAAVLKFLAAK